MKKLSLIVPFYNEDRIITKKAQRIINYLDENINNYEVIFVDDGSTDSSWVSMSTFLKGKKNIKLIRNKVNQGRGEAIRKGFAIAKGNVLGYIDCDLEIKPEYIKKSMELLSKYDVVVVSKLVPGAHVQTPFIRKISSSLFNQIVKIVLNSYVSDHQAGLKIFHRNVIDTLMPLTSEKGWLWDVEILYLIQKKEYSIYELPIRIRYGFRKIRGSFFVDFLKLPFILLSTRFALDKRYSVNFQNE